MGPLLLLLLLPRMEINSPTTSRIRYYATTTRRHVQPEHANQNLIILNKDLQQQKKTMSAELTTSTSHGLVIQAAVQSGAEYATDQFKPIRILILLQLQLENRHINTNSKMSFVISEPNEFMNPSICNLDLKRIKCLNRDLRVGVGYTSTHRKPRNRRLRSKE